MAPYILDFYCHEALLAVELDGRSHGLRREEDEARDAWLNGRGIEVLRLSVSAFERDIGAALARIADTAEQRIKVLRSMAREPTFASGQGGPVEGVETEPPPSACRRTPPPVGEEGT